MTAKGLATFIILLFSIALANSGQAKIVTRTGEATVARLVFYQGAWIPSQRMPAKPLRESPGGGEKRHRGNQDNEFRQRWQAPAGR